MPSPKMSLSPAMAAELTIGSFSDGVVLVQSVRWLAWGSTARQDRVGTLKAPIPHTINRWPCGTGVAMKWSWLGRVQRTCGGISRKGAKPQRKTPSAAHVQFIGDLPLRLCAFA